MVGQQVSKGELRGEDGILELEIRHVLADRRGIPIHFTLRNQFTYSRSRERLCQRPNGLDRLFRSKVNEKGSVNTR